MHIVLKEGIQSLLTKPEQGDPFGKLERITKYSVFERNRVGG